MIAIRSTSAQPTAESLARPGDALAYDVRAHLARPEARAAGIGFAAVTIFGFDQGGFFEPTWRFAILAFSAATGLAIVRRGAVSLARFELVSFGALVLLATWTLLSFAWGTAGTNAGPEAERVLVYVAGLAAMLMVTERSSIRALLTGVSAGTVAIAVFALGDRVFAAPKALDPLEGGLLFKPLGYANALGIVLAIGLVIAIGLLIGERRAWVIGSLVACALVLATALGLTSSRGAWLSLGSGLVVVTAWRRPRTGRRRSVAVAAIVCLAIPAWLTLFAGSGLGDRPAYWRAALLDASGHPLAGSGAGSFDDYWYRHGTINASVTDAHSLYLESLAELGVIGLVLVLIVLLPPLAAGVAARKHPEVAIAAGAYATFLVHAGIDWDWEMPATTLTGLACGAALLIAARPLERTLTTADSTDT